MAHLSKPPSATCNHEVIFDHRSRNPVEIDHVRVKNVFSARPVSQVINYSRLFASFDELTRFFSLSSCPIQSERNIKKIFCSKERAAAASAAASASASASASVSASQSRSNFFGVWTKSKQGNGFFFFFAFFQRK